MLSLPYTPAIRPKPPNPLLSPKPSSLQLPSAPPPRKRPCRCRPIAAASSSSFYSSGEPAQTLFRGGFKRPEIPVPALALQLTAADVLCHGGEASVSAAVAKGFRIVVLDAGEETGGKFYEAARSLKSLLGERAFLLIAERVDVASAVGASGVVLSDDGIPAIVARNMMMASKSDSIYLPLVARMVKSSESAMSASSSDGADFLILRECANDVMRELENLLFLQVKIPVFFSIMDLVGHESPAIVMSKLISSGASGIVLSLGSLKKFNEVLSRNFFTGENAVDCISQDGHIFSSKLEADNIRIPNNGINKLIAGFTNLDGNEQQLIEMERSFLNEAVAIFQKASPMMDEVSLLMDAASRLSEPFLLVIVGEFNSGKSTVINALLGRKYLKDGVVPTTNEITLLSYSEADSNERERCERHPDGQFICYLSSPILKEMNLVDTPGTNVILQRQQKLTEEFVPRADLVIFVMSADRPLTESEVSFLLYVQQWKKKVVFVLNKLDLYQNIGELEEAMVFVRENARKLLSTEDVMIFPVSARFALEVKLSTACNGSNKDKLLDDPRWMSSKFHELEDFLYSFLDGTTENGKERVRLKLETPIAIADRLLSSCQRIVKLEYENAVQNMKSIDDVILAAKAHSHRMEVASAPWRKQITSIIERAEAKVIKLMESTLQLSNLDLISTYTFKGEKKAPIAATSTIQNDILGPALTDAQSLLSEYSRWLQSSNVREANDYRENILRQWELLIDRKDIIRLCTYELAAENRTHSSEVLENFNSNSAAHQFEQEIREVALGTFGGLGAAGLSASLLTSVLSTTLEDLLALAFCSAGGLLAINNFPNRRKEALEKVKKFADSLTREVESALQKDLSQSAEQLNRFVETLCKPYRDAVQQRLDSLQETQVELSTVEQKMQTLKAKIQNLNIS